MGERLAMLPESGGSGQWLDTGVVIHHRPNPLLVVQISLFCLDGKVPKAKLGLLQLAPSSLAQPGTSATKVVGREFGYTRGTGDLLHNLPADVLRHSVNPRLGDSAHPPETTFDYHGGIAQKYNYAEE